MRVLGFGTYDLGKHPRVGTVLDGLRAHGDDVVEVNAPLGFGTDERIAMVERPWLAYRLALRLLSRWAVLVRRTVRVRRGGRFDAVVVGYLGHFDVLLARLLFPRTVIVFDLMVFAADTAQDRGVGGKLRLAVLSALERLAISCSTVVIVDTEEHATLLPAGASGKCVVVPVGAPDDWFVPDPGDSHRPGDDVALRVVFFGLYAPLQGATVIGEALACLADRADIRTTMIGDGQDRESTWQIARQNGRIDWLDWVEPERLPTLVAEHDVCLGIFGTGPKAYRVVPNKVYQGAAAGCVIVTSDTEPQRRALGDSAVYVPAGDSAALVHALEKLAAEPTTVRDLRAAVHKVAYQHFTPAAVVVPLRRRLEAR